MACRGGYVEVVSNNRLHPATSVKEMSKETALFSMISQLMENIELLVFDVGVRDLLSEKVPFLGHTD